MFIWDRRRVCFLLSILLDDRLMTWRSATALPPVGPKTRAKP